MATKSAKNVNDKILGIIYCEFHVQEGPKITYQVNFVKIDHTG